MAFLTLIWWIGGGGTTPWRETSGILTRCLRNRSTKRSQYLWHKGREGLVLHPCHAGNESGRQLPALDTLRILCSSINGVAYTCYLHQRFCPWGAPIGAMVICFFQVRSKRTQKVPARRWRKVYEKCAFMIMIDGERFGWRRCVPE